MDLQSKTYGQIKEILKKKGWNIEQSKDTANPWNFELLPQVPTMRLPTLKVNNPDHHKWREVLEYHTKGEVQFTRISITEAVVILWSPPVPGSKSDRDQAVILIDFAAETIESVEMIRAAPQKSDAAQFEMKL